MARLQLHQLTNRQFANLLTAASFGALFEWYDFYLAATAAAEVWPKIFFPAHLDPALALAASIMSVGISYLARPLGAIIFGHLGDRYGRRNTLVYTLLLMGIASLGTALLPAYSLIGVFAVVGVFGFRFMTGCAAGGESGGAFSWIAEARPNSKHRGFWISWASAVLTIGKLMSMLSFYIASTMLSSAAYVDWGWRIPFAVGALMLGVAIVIRLKIMESPMFQELRAKRSVLKYPVKDLFKEQGRKIFILLWINIFVPPITSLVILPYSVSFLIKLGTTESFANLSIALASAVATFALLGGAFISDYVGRLTVARVGAVLTIIMLYPYFWLLQTLNPILIILGQTLLYVVGTFSIASNTALYTESFPTKYRYSGGGVTYQLNSFFTGILISTALPIFLMNYGIINSWQPVVWLVILLAISSILSSFIAKETKGKSLD